MHFSKSAPKQLLLAFQMILSILYFFHLQYFRTKNCQLCIKYAFLSKCRKTTFVGISDDSEHFFIFSPAFFFGTSKSLSISRMCQKIKEKCAQHLLFIRIVILTTRFTIHIQCSALIRFYRYIVAGIF